MYTDTNTVQKPTEKLGVLLQISVVIVWVTAWTDYGLSFTLLEWC